MNNIIMGLINLTEIKNTKELKAKIDFSKLVYECVYSYHYLNRSAKVVINKNIEPLNFMQSYYHQYHFTESD